MENKNADLNLTELYIVVTECHNLVGWAVGRPTWVSPQSASRSANPFLQGSQTWQTDRQTDRQTTQSVAAARIVRNACVVT